MDIIRNAGNSVANYLRLVFAGNLHLNHDRLGTIYRIKHHGSYAIFRETHSNDNAPGSPVVLVVGFRLKVARNSHLIHWLFQRVSVLTTPFWSGFAGFRVKLWMVDPQTHNYMGIYNWAGHSNAKHYAETLKKVLDFCSVGGSVGYSIYNEPLELYLANRYQR